MAAGGAKVHFIVLNENRLSLCELGSTARSIGCVDSGDDSGSGVNSADGHGFVLVVVTGGDEVNILLEVERHTCWMIDASRGRRSIIATIIVRSCACDGGDLSSGGVDHSNCIVVGICEINKFQLGPLRFHE